ncbi:CaiB/BaiF CoA transferase family protein [Amycolatopsis sp. CA-230715]|uniref:CaiB/BaiF CoA transferase family protein n=1 Tax=Amycolatopsis sp. CA-230715 TaxID=2745196 RepID=UPI001C018C75|nr:CoA transferase [Amycolatopsis sp. CA-230715]QWF84838.1 Succinyl-CoA--L-malate CoA-transferase beta subunit [Amycolatopsis sp. CA-230715]
MEREEFYAEARTDRAGPLDGIRVLDATRVWSGPQATCVLADLGADVIRVELPSGRDGDLPPRIPGTTSSWFRETVNRNKRSVGLDLRSPDGQEAFLGLVRTADVVVENYRPGTLDRWGVGYRACREVRADIVFVSITGWGQYGPGADRPGYDPVVQAAGGWMSLNGEPGGAAMRAPTFLADELAGLHGAIGALAALRHRSETGEGQHVDVSMLDSLLFGSCGLPTLAAAGEQPRRQGNETDFVVPANVFPCQDGPVYLAVAMNRQWRALAALAGRPELATAPGYDTASARLANRDAVNAVVADWCRRHTAAEVAELAAAAGVTASPVRSLAQVVADPHVLAREMVQPTVLRDGSTAPLVGPAVKFSRTPTRVRTPAPVVGEHSEEVLGETVPVGEMGEGFR